jgi:AraC-like DNA-binding protein
MSYQEEDGDLANGFLIVRASGAAAAARAAFAGIVAGRTAASTPDDIQLLLRCTVPSAVATTGTTLTFADCTLHVVPVGPGPHGVGPSIGQHGAVMLTVATSRLSIGFNELRPLMFQPVTVDATLRGVFANAVANVLSAGHALDPHGIAYHLVGLAELVLRSALRAELDRLDPLAARRRDAVDYIRAHLSEPTLSAERIAEALFISRRRLYQLFDDGDGVSGRIRTLRVERAKALLGDPARAGQGIAEISRDCGFANATHFSRTFRKVVGQTPREFRDHALRRPPMATRQPPSTG